MKKKLLIPSLVLASLFQTNPTLARDTETKKQLTKEYCTNDNILCITPMLTNKSNLFVNHSGEPDLDVYQTNIGAKVTGPNKAFFVKFNGSVMPIIKSDSVQDEYNATVNERARMGTNYIQSELGAAFAKAEAGVAAALAQAGIAPASPMYKPLHDKYITPYAMQIQQIGAAAQQAGAERVHHAKNEGDYRNGVLVNQDSIQEVVVGYDDGTYFFNVGKFSAGFDPRTRNITEMNQYVAETPVTDALKTSGQGRSNIQVGRRDLELQNGIKITLVAFAGKEGRVFLSAIQDTSNALRMTDQKFRQDAELVGFDNGGGSLTFKLGETGNSLTVTGMAGPYGASGGAEVRFQVTPDVVAHVAYLYANKFGAQGHQVRGQIDFHIGEKFGAQWVVALYGESSRVQDYSLLPTEVDSQTGMVERTKVGASISATKTDLLGHGTRTTIILDTAYLSDGQVSDGTNFLTGKSVNSNMISDEVIPRLGFSLQY